MSDTPKPKKRRVNGAVKGKQYEREISVKLRALYPEAKRGNQDNMVNTEADVEGTPFRVECKSLQSIGAFRFYDQARAEQKLHGDARPIMVVMREKRNHVSGQLDLAMVPLPVMLELLQAAARDRGFSDWFRDQIEAAK